MTKVLFFGYACNETEELMPLPIAMAKDLTNRLTYVRKNNIIEGLRPDGKSQVTVEYKNDKPIRIEHILISTQHFRRKATRRIKKRSIRTSSTTKVNIVNL